MKLDILFQNEGKDKMDLKWTKINSLKCNEYLYLNWHKDFDKKFYNIFGEF